MKTRKDIIQQSEYKEQVNKLLKLSVKYRNILKIHHGVSGRFVIKNDYIIIYYQDWSWQRYGWNTCLKKKKKRWWQKNKKIFEVATRWHRVYSNDNKIIVSSQANWWHFSEINNVEDLVLIHDACILLETKIEELEIDNESHRYEHNEIESQVNGIAEVIEISNEL